MVRYNGPIRVFNPSDGIPTDAAGGGAGGDQTAAALSGMSAQAQAAWQTVDNLSATATTGPVGSGASVTVTGTVPNKTINFTIPRGRDGKDGIGNDAAVQVAMSQQAGTAMRVGVQAGTVGLLVIADSKGAGTGLTNYADRWQNRLAALMRARFPITGGDTMRGLIPANMSDPYNAMSGRPTTTGTTYPVDTAGLGYNTLQLELGSVLTFPAATWPAASTLPIGYHTHYGANGTLQVLIDGVVQTEINCAGAGEGAPMRTSIPIAAGTHTVSMRPKAGTAPVRPMYIEQRSTATGWHLYDAARPGLAARHVIDRPGAPQGGSSFAAAVAGLPSVRLAVVALGANDMTISTPAQYGADIRAVVGMVKAGHPTAGVVVVLPAALTDDSAVVDDVQAYHTAARAALVDVPDLSIVAETQLVDLTGPNAGAWLADSVHPNAFGHDLISRALAGSLIGLDGPSDALTLVEAAAAPAVTAAQSAQTSAASSASSAANAVTLAQQAQAAALEVPDANMRAILDNPATETGALARMWPRYVPGGQPGGQQGPAGANSIGGLKSNAIGDDLSGCLIAGGGTDTGAVGGYANVIGAGIPANIGTTSPNYNMADPTLLRGTNANVSAILGGYDNLASGLASMIASQHGYIAPAATHASIFGGSYHKILAGDYSVILGGTDSTIEAGVGQVLLGRGITLKGAGYNTASGINHVVDGQSNTAIGSSHVVTGSFNTAMGALHNVTTSEGTALGRENTVTGQSGTAVGRLNTVAGFRAFAAGESNVANGTASIALGLRSQALAVNSYAHGRDAIAKVDGQEAFATGYFTTPGDAQASKFTLRTQTTTAASTVIGTNGGSIGQWLMLNGATVFEATVIAFEPATNDTKAWKITGIARQGASGAAVLVAPATVTVINASAGAAAWNTAVVPGTQTITVRAIGEAGKTIRWSAILETVEVAA